MATLHVAWIALSHPQYGNAQGMIENIISGAAVTTSGTSAQSAAAPALAEYAVCTSVDANHYVAVGADPTAAATNSVCIPTGHMQVIPVIAGVSKIAAVTV